MSTHSDRTLRFDLSIRKQLVFPFRWTVRNHETDEDQTGTSVQSACRRVVGVQLDRFYRDLFPRNGHAQYRDGRRLLRPMFHNRLRLSAEIRHLFDDTTAVLSNLDHRLLRAHVDSVEESHHQECGCAIRGIHGRGESRAVLAPGRREAS